MNYSGTQRPVRTLVAEDDLNHPVEPHPFFNESRYVHRVDGVRGIGGWFRIVTSATASSSSASMACVPCSTGSSLTLAIRWSISRASRPTCACARLPTH